MRKEDFWDNGEYPTQKPDNQTQPSDDIRWQQLLDFNRRHAIIRFPVERTRPANVIPAERLEQKRRKQ